MMKEENANRNNGAANTSVGRRRSAMQIAATSRKSTVWTRDKITQLIELYKNHDCLWNHWNDSYKNKEKRSRAIEHICSILSISKFEFGKKIHNLRNQFNAEMKKLEQRMEAGGGTTDGAESEAGDDTKPLARCKWNHFESLMFLRDVIEPRPGGYQSTQASKKLRVKMDYNNELEESEIYGTSTAMHNSNNNTNNNNNGNHSTTVMQASATSALMGNPRVVVLNGNGNGTTSLLDINDQSHQLQGTPHRFIDEQRRNNSVTGSGGVPVTTILEDDLKNNTTITVEGYRTFAGEELTIVENNHSNNNSTTTNNSNINTIITDPLSTNNEPPSTPLELYEPATNTNTINTTAVSLTTCSNASTSNNNNNMHNNGIARIGASGGGVIDTSFANIGISPGISSSNSSVLAQSPGIAMTSRDQWDTFGDLIASEFRHMNSDISRKRLKRKIMQAMLEIGEEDDELLVN